MTTTAAADTTTRAPWSTKNKVGLGLALARPGWDVHAMNAGVFNLFNDDSLINFNNTINPDFDGPVDALGHFRGIGGFVLEGRGNTQGDADVVEDPGRGGRGVQKPGRGVGEHT